MLKTSEKFEQQITRIHELIEQTGSIVTWNDRVPDPDNPLQSRQIDITIKREGSLTLIECRIHKEPQDVTWIEELIGRRVSLGADAVIAVSYSGFTKGAIQKAKTYGIILRDFKSLTEEEIKQWGHKTRLWVSYHNFSNMRLDFLFGKEAKNFVTADDIFNYLSQHGNFFRIMEPIVGEIDKMKLDKSSKHKTRMVVQLFPENVDINGFTMKEVNFQFDYAILKREANISAIVAYDGPEIDALERLALIEKGESEGFEITQSSNTVSVALNFDKIGLPINSRIRDIVFDFRRAVKLQGVEFLAQPKLYFLLTDMVINVFFLNEKIRYS